MRKRTSFCLLASTLLALASLPAARAQDAPPPPLPIGSHAPALAVKTLTGKHLTLASLRGHVVLLDFWATWCGPCRMAIPTLENLHKKFGTRGLRVIGVSVDAADTAALVPAFAHQMHVTYTLSVGPTANGQAAQRYNATGIPSQYLIDKKGVIRWAQAGYSLNEGQELAAMIRKLLAQ